MVGHHRMHSGALQDSAQQILSNLGGHSGLGISGIARNQPRSLNPGLNFSLSGHSQSDIFVNPLGRGGKVQARTAIPTKESTTPSGSGAMLKNQASLGIFGERKNLVKQHDLNEATSKRPVPIRSQNFNVFKQSELNSLLRN